MPESLASQICSLLRSGVEGRPHQLFPGVACGLDDGQQVIISSFGDAYRYADANGSPLPEDASRPVTDDTLSPTTPCSISLR